MWVLECEGDLFEGKRIWLRPGRTFLFGRTGTAKSPDERTFQIINKSVSRKHLIIAVSPVKAGDGRSIYARSTITLTDESKIGTTIDNEKIVRQSKVLTNKTHAIRLGNYDQLFRVTWRPCVLSFSQLSKKGQPEVTDVNVDKLELLDVKTTEPYIIDSTTHVISAKRNIPKGLQALINAKHIVTEAFIGALINVTTSSGVAEDGTTALPCLLEEDFDKHWPDAMRYLPEPGKEPKPRAAEFYAPNATRINIFEGFTFIFADPAQYENLHAVINNGGAKCLQYTMRIGETPMSDFVTYIKSVACKKGQMFIPGERKTVAVRFRSKGSTAQWAIDFCRDLDQELGQRSIEQNEFLDAILTNNSSNLCKSLVDEDSGTTAPPSTAVTVQQSQPASQAPQQSQDEPQLEATQLKTAPRQRNRRMVTQSRFKGFDDFDSSQAIKPSKTQLQDDSSDQLQAASVDMADDSQNQTQKPIARSNKRHASEEPAFDYVKADAEMLDNILPASRVVKRQRIEFEPMPKPKADQVDTLSDDDKAVKRSKDRASKRDIDYRSALHSHAEALDTRSPSIYPPDSTDAITANGEPLPNLNNLAIIEEMPMPARRTRPARARDSTGANARWDPAWNGRRNFKRFQRRGEGPANRGVKIIVALEEVKQKGGLDMDVDSIDDPYFLQDSSHTRSTRPARRERSQSHGLFVTQESEIEDDDDDDEEPVQSGARSWTARENRVTSMARPMAKRPAEETASSSGRQPAKRVRTSASGTNSAARGREESSDEDEMRFRFRR